MLKAVIAVVGSVDPSRTDYDPPLKNLEAANDAAKELGQELARASLRLMIFSSNPHFIEADFVRGYVSSGVATHRSIEIRYPQIVGDVSQPTLPEQLTHRDVFEAVTDSEVNWRVGFYRALQQVNGVLIIGGAKSALITGLIAQMYAIPMVSISTFGGSGQSIWALSAGRLATNEDRRLMGRPTWEKDSAELLVKSLVSQRVRLLTEELAARKAEKLEDRRLRRRALGTGVLTLVTAVAAGAGTFLPVSDRFVFGLFFFGIPLLAGGTGGLALNLIEYFQGTARRAGRTGSISCVLGMIAGLIAALLFVVAQWASNPEIKNLEHGIPTGMHLLVPFELIIGFTAGLTLEAVFAKLQRADVLNLKPVASKNAEAGGS